MNVFRDRVKIQVRTRTMGATGETIVWSPVGIRHARVIPLDAKALVVYQQIHSNVTHQIVFRGSVSLDLGEHRFIWRDKTLMPIDPAQELENTTTIMAGE